MISTTLMTFLLITKPEVRSVKLLGSWDNFSKQYVMERDTRVGPGHWRGCHTFTDMIGDGPDKTQWRTGGLKMGGTYWYYYLLDNDIEYYNEAEPTTTMCPLLPGQPMNVLNVPIILPDSRAHGRSASGSSQRSEHLRTMHPEDKFMNPRKPPPQPQPIRLQTSAPVRREPSPGHSSSRSPDDWNSSQCISDAQCHPKFEPVQLVNASNMVPQNEPVENSRNIPGIKVNAGIAIPSSSSPDKLGLSTIQSRRAMKAIAGEVAPDRLLTVQTRPQFRKPIPSRSAANGNTAVFDDNRGIREALQDIGSSGDFSTPTAAFTKEKRLPTLPNTPSSVMDEAVRAIDERDKAMDSEIPRSYFSSMTTTTTVDSTDSHYVPEYSRFSEWSTDTETDYNSHESTVSASASNHHQDESSAERWTTPDLSQSGDGATNTDPNTPHLTVYSKHSSPNSASGELPPWSVGLPQLTLSLSSPGFDCSGLGIENIDEALAMSRSPNGSPILLPQVSRGSDTEQDLSPTERKVSETSLERIRSRRSNTSFQGNATMQELMDELSYLKNLIQADMDGAPF
ncbi:hypothetical protein N7453_011745 [Penicillium expansum]|nr:hypothetical protein N7453_011745 [Penicillium expansum]